MKPLCKNILLVGAGVLIGSLTTYGLSRTIFKSHFAFLSGSFAESTQAPEDFLNGIFGQDFFNQSQDPFDQMRQMHEQMLRQYGQQNPQDLQESDEQIDENSSPDLHDPFDSWFKKRFGGGKVMDFHQRADADFLYYEITVPGLKNEKLNVGVEDGTVTISGVMEQKVLGGEGEATSTTSFQRSFPLPPEVDGDKVDAEIKGDKLILRFPKKRS